MNKEQFKQLEKLVIYTNRFLLENEINRVVYFFSIKKPSAMESLSFFSEIKFNLNQFNDIIHVIKHDNIKNYYLQFSQKSFNEDQIKKFKLEKYYYIDRHLSEIHSLIYCWKRKGVDKIKGMSKVFKNIMECLKEKRE